MSSLSPRPPSVDFSIIDHPISSEPNSPSNPLKRIWDALPPRSKRRPTLLSLDLSFGFDEEIDYSALSPLDGDEGELIDEGCFFAVSTFPRVVTGIDILALIPPELALLILSYLPAPALGASLGVSRTWRALARDPNLWQKLFSARGWNVDVSRARARGWKGSEQNPRYGYGKSHGRTGELNWRALYRKRHSLEQRWKTGVPRVRTIEGHNDSVYCLDFDTSRIITGARDHTVRAWDLHTGACLGIFRGHMGSVLCLKFQKDWDIPSLGPGCRKEKIGWLVSGSSDSAVVVWNLRVVSAGEISAEPQAVLRAHTGGVLDVKVSDRYIVSCSKDAAVAVHTATAPYTHLHTLHGHLGPVNAVGLCDDWVVSAGGSGVLVLWNAETGACVRSFEGYGRGLACVDLFKGRLAVSGQAEGEEGEWVISGSNDCTIRAYNARTGRCVRTFAGHAALVRALAVGGGTGGRLVSASYDKSVRVWDLGDESGGARVFDGVHRSHVFDVKFDVRRIVSASHDQKIVIMDFSQDPDDLLFV